MVYVCFRGLTDTRYFWRSRGKIDNHLINFFVIETAYYEVVTG